MCPPAVLKRVKKWQIKKEGQDDEGKQSSGETEREKESGSNI